MPKTAVKSKFVARQNRELLLHGPEIGVFLACLGMVNELRALEIGLDAGKLSPAAVMSRSNAVLAQFTETLEATERFDIVMPIIEQGQFSPFFWSWFNWWDDYFKAMPPKQVRQLERRASEGLADEDHRPAGHWLRHRQEPAFSVVTA